MYLFKMIYRTKDAAVIAHQLIISVLNQEISLNNTNQTQSHNQLI